MNKQYLITIVLIIIGAGSFFAGMKYQESKRGQFSRQFAGQQGDHPNSQGQRFSQGARPVRGEIIKSDDTSITIKLQDGSSKIIFVSEKTAINKAAEGSKDDLKTKEQVLIFGNENSDGSVTAQSIQLGSSLRDNFGGSQR